MAAALRLMATAPAALAQEGMNIVFTHHSSASNTFWQAVQSGFDDACERVEANCQMIFTQTEGSIEQQLANMDAALAREPRCAPDLDRGRQRAGRHPRARGRPGHHRDRRERGRQRGRCRQRRGRPSWAGLSPSGLFARSGDVGALPRGGADQCWWAVSAPGQNWSELRAGGVIMTSWRIMPRPTPTATVTYERIDSGTDLADRCRPGRRLPERQPRHDRVFRYRVLACRRRARSADRGIEPGEVLLGGFDLVPEVVQQMEAGYVQVQVDQQPYMQGFMPVMQAYLVETRAGAGRHRHRAGHRHARGCGEIMELSEQGTALSEAPDTDRRRGRRLARALFRREAGTRCNGSSRSRWKSRSSPLRSCSVALIALFQVLSGGFFPERGTTCAASWAFCPRWG